MPKTEHEWWLGTTIGLFSLDIRSGQFTFYGGGYGENIIDIRYDNAKGNVFIVTESGLLFCYNEIEKIYKEIAITRQPYPVVQWNKNKIQSITHPLMQAVMGNRLPFHKGLMASSSA